MGPSTCDLQQTYSTGDLVSGSVRRLLRYGAVVVVDDTEVKGIIRNRELSWEVEPDHPSEVLSVRAPVTALVLKVDQRRNRLELSLRQAERDPWEDIDSRYQEGQVIRRKVVRLWRTGAFVELEPAVDAFVPLDEICWPPPERVEDVLWVDDTFEGVVIRIDHGRRQIAFSLRRWQHRIRELQEEAEQHAVLRQEKLQGVSIAEHLSDKSRAALVQVLRERRQESRPQSPRERPSEAVVGNMRRILLADDDPSFRGSLHRLLERIGYEVVAVESAEKAVDSAARENFDLVLMDIGFPSDSMGGVESVERILSINASLPVVMITGIAWSEQNAGVIQEARKLGARSALLKPVRLDSLQTVIRPNGKSRTPLAPSPKTEGGESAQFPPLPGLGEGG